MLRHLVGGVLHGLDDVVIAGTAAEVAGETVSDLGLGRAWVLLEQVVRRHDHAGCAEAALEPVHLPEAFLKRVQVAVGGETFDRGYLSAVGLDREEGAGLDRGAVENDCTRSAVGGVTADVCAGQVENVSQVFDEQEPRLDVGHVLRAVDCYGNLTPHCKSSQLVLGACRVRQGRLYQQLSG